MFTKHYILSFFDTKKAAIKKIKLFNRSYNKFKKNKKIFIFRKIKGELTKVNISFDNIFKKILIFFYNDYKKIDLDLCISQYVFQRISFRRLNLNILKSSYYNTKLIFPLPKTYHKTFSDNDVNISKITCSILWYLYCFLLWSYGNLIFLKIIFKSFKNLNKNAKSGDLYFTQINKENLPFKSIYKKRISYDLISWFLNFYKNKDIKIKDISHDNSTIDSYEHDMNKIYYLDHPYFFIKNFFNIIKYFVIGIFLSLLSVLLLFFGKWQFSFLIGEIFKANSFLNLDKSKIAKKYFFHYSESFYRPIWTYFAENFNIEIILYFYSTYDSPKVESSSNIDKSFEFGNISWSNILVWDEIQKKTIEKYISKKIKNFQIQIVEPIWFRDKDFVFSKKKIRILIFDMEVQRNSLHFGWGEIAEYNNFDESLTFKFIKDIIEVFDNENIEFVLKRKRKIGMNAKTNYKKYISHLKKNISFIELDQNISPIYLMENANIVITTPFTSANMYKTSKNFHNIFYDPIKFVKKNDLAARNIPIINGIDELKAWKKKNYNVDQ